jgi:hypothetical protein
VSEAIASFKTGSSGGPDGLRPQHLKDLTSKGAGPAGEYLIEALTDVLNLILAGNVPQDIVPILFGASLIALDKKGGGIRPIAIGCTLRRLAAKLGSSSVIEELGTLLRPKQMGFGTQCGAEAIVHSVRQFISADEGILVKLDYANAFNSVFRSRILEVAQDKAPKLVPLILQAYGSPSHLFFGSDLVASAEGLQQGDPLAPALFCLVIHPLVESLKSLLNVWYLDDGTLGGPGKLVLSDLKTVMAASSDIGLQLNPSKCEIKIMGNFDQESVSAITELLPGIKILGAADSTLLGAPLTEEALNDALSQKIDQIELIVNRLPKLSAHTALFLLKNCLSMPKMTYLLRCSPMFKVSSLLGQFDLVMRNALEQITNVTLDDDAWAQASLPVSRGGLGIRSALDLSIPAFLASAFYTSSLVSSILSSIPSNPYKDREEAFIEWSNITGSTQPPLSNQQRDWETPVLEMLSSSLIQNATTPQTKARLLAVSKKESGAWLCALPSPPLGLVLDDASLRIAVGLRLGTHLCHPHKCRCGEPVDHFGTHGLCCSKKGGKRIGTFSRHSAINEIIRQAFSKVSVPTLLEPPGMFRTDGKRADGVTLVPWSRGKCLVWDATCTDTLCKSNVSSTSRTPGAAAAKSENKKRDLYSELPSQYTFCPFAVETLGTFGEEALKLTHDLGRRLRIFTGDSRETSWLIQRISLAIQRGNSASVLSTMSTAISFSQIYTI